MDYSHLMRTPEEVDRLFPWLCDDLIRGIPHFISPAWTNDRSQFDAELWADWWQRIGFGSVTLLTGHHDGYLLYPSKLQKQQPDRDYFGEQVAACRTRGMNVLAYYSLTLDSLVGSEHPEWRVRDMAGRIFPPNYEHFSHYHWLCLNSPYCDYVVTQLEEVVDNYDVEGVWIDILYLPGHTEDLERDTCFCDYCHKQYSEWTGGEHLLDAAGTPRANDFRALTYRHFLASLKTMLMRKDRPLALTFNGAGRRRMAGYKICDDLTDFFSGEAHNPTSLSITSKSHRNSGRAFELLSCSEVCWSHNQLKPDTLIKLESLSTLIAGGTYTMGITQAPDGRLSEPNVRRLEAWGQWINARRDLFRPAEPVYEMGILAPELGPVGIEKWAEWLRKGHFLFDVFMDVPRGLSPEDRVAVTEGADPDDGDRPPSPATPASWGQPPSLILIPQSRSVTAAEAAQLREYVVRGGKLLFEAPLAAWRDHQPWIEELTGARQLREHSAYAFYLEPRGMPSAGPAARRSLRDLSATPADSSLWANLTGDPVMLYARQAAEVELQGAGVVADLVFQFKDKVRTSDIQTVANFWARPDELPRPPGVLVNRLGDGLVMSTTVPLTVRNQDEDRCPWPEMLACNCVRVLLGEPTVSVGAYNQVEVNLCQQPHRLVLHFVNHLYGAGQTMHGFGETQFLRELPVRLSPELRRRVRAARLEPEGTDLPLTDEGFIVPELGVYQAVTLLT